MDLFLLFMLHVCLCYVVLSVTCSRVITCWEKAGLTTLLCVMFFCVFVTSPYDVPGLITLLCGMFSCVFVRCPGSGVVLDCIDS